MSDLKKQIVFKVGTALAKCYKTIERFSEDIDLVLVSDGSQSASQLKKQLKSITEQLQPVLPEVDSPGITNKKGMIRKTVHQYPIGFKGIFGQVRDFIIVESSWLGYFEPYHESEVSSFVYDMMVRNGQEELIAKYGLAPFPLLTLDAERTFCEKIMSLVRFSHTATPIADLRNKIRHTYDLYQLLKMPTIRVFFQSEAFGVMLQKVANDDLKSFKTNNDWLQVPPREALLFADTKNVWPLLVPVYNGSFRELVFGNLPAPDDIRGIILEIGKRLNEIEWNIDFYDANEYILLESK